MQLKSACIKKLNGFESERAGAANVSLSNSVESSWQGLFMPKDEDFPKVKKKKTMAEIAAFALANEDRGGN